MGAVKRLRPKLMTVSVSLFGLIPILWSTGVGSDVMRPITIPLIGGTITSTIYVLLVTPVVFEIVKEFELKRKGKIELVDEKGTIEQWTIGNKQVAKKQRFGTEFFNRKNVT